MKRLFMVLLLVFSLAACGNSENVIFQNGEDTGDYKVLGEGNTYESSYVKNYSFSIPIMNEIYYRYNEVFAGVYLVDGVYNINITENAPQILITKLEQSSVSYHIVEFSFADMWTVNEMVLDRLINMNMRDWGMGVSEKDNTVKLTLKTGTIVPESFNHYIEIGILTIDFTDLTVTF